jgi:membrane associated rhomboid family serine protease
MLPIPIGTDRPQRRRPLMNLALIAANVVVYLMSHRTGAHAGPAGLAPGWDRYMLTPLDPHLYQFITYQFLHENFLHILFNMVFLYVFGNNLNEKLGHVGYLAFYLTGGVLAGCGQMLTSTAPTLGASGAISATAGMFLALLPRTHIRIFIWIFVYVDVWEIPSAWFILFSVGKDIVEPLLFHGNGTAYAAHLTGDVAGFAIGMFLLLTKLVQRDHYDLLAVLDRYRRRKQYEAVVASGYNPYGPGGNRIAALKKPASPPPPSPEELRKAELRMEIGDLIHARQLAAAVEKYLELRRLDPQAVLGADDQLDIANQLMAEGRHAPAAEAYEDYLRQYPNTSQYEHTVLILALIYGQYVPRRQRAIELVKGVIPRLHDAGQRTFAEEELARLEGEQAGGAGGLGGEAAT